LPKLSHCNIWFNPSDFFTLAAEEQHAAEFAHQVLMIAVCPRCKQERRGWYGIYHDGTEDWQVHGINPKRFYYWDVRISPQSAEVQAWPDGALSVTAQRKWENKYSSGMTMQRVR
jgi:hypothetical protein